MTAIDPAPLDPADIHPRYRGYAGFVTTPCYFDDSPQQFLAVAPAGVGVMQRVLHIPGYAYELDDRTRNFGLLEEAAECLADSHCQVVGQVGSNWVHTRGTTPDEIAAFCDDLSDRIGARFLMAGHCIVEALRHLGARTIAVSNAYYRDDWRDGINRYLEQAGFEILSSGHMRDQGLYTSLDEQIEVEDLTVWDHPDRDVLESIRLAHEAAPDADAVVQTGSGFRTSPHVPYLESRFDKPVVASDNALYWAMLRELDLGEAVTGHGHLLGTL
jgi:maleate cis-trans isomerase